MELWMIGVLSRQYDRMWTWPKMKSTPNELDLTPPSARVTLVALRYAYLTSTAIGCDVIGDRKQYKWDTESFEIF